MTHAQPGACERCLCPERAPECSCCHLDPCHGSPPRLDAALESHATIHAAVAILEQVPPAERAVRLEALRVAVDRWARELGLPEAAADGVYERVRGLIERLLAERVAG
jgi:hypothetical protein